MRLYNLFKLEVITLFTKINLLSLKCLGLQKVSFVSNRGLQCSNDVLGPCCWRELIRTAGSSRQPFCIGRKRFHCLYFYSIIFLLYFSLAKFLVLSYSLIFVAIKPFCHTWPKVFKISKETILTYGPWPNYWYALLVINTNRLIQEFCGFNPDFEMLGIFTQRSIIMSLMCWKFVKRSD